MLTKNEQILLLILFFIAIYIKWKINNLEKKNIEKFTLTDTETQEAIKTSIKRIYLTDVEAIRLLSNFAIQLNQNGVTIPGNVKFLGTVTTNNITTNNITGNGNINLMGTGKITATNINAINIDILSNTINTINNIDNLNVTGNISAGGNISISGNISVEGNLLKLNNGSTSTNKYAINVPNDTTNIMQIGRINNASNQNYDFTEGFKFNGTTGTFECKEIICKKISGFNNRSCVIGAWLFISNLKICPIFHSLINYSDYLVNDEDNGYIIMPGYKLIRYSDRSFNGTNVEMNNWNGTKPLTYDVKNNDYGSSCKLFYWIGPSATEFIEIKKT
jgi:hypothetical protein